MMPNWAAKQRLAHAHLVMQPVSGPCLHAQKLPVQPSWLSLPTDHRHDYECIGILVFSFAMKHTKQTTLFGCFAPADRVVYANPARPYEKFVNAFVAASSKSKKEAVDEANKAWPSYRDDRDKLTKFFDKPTGPTDKNGKPLDFGFRREVIDGEAPKGNEGVSRSAPSATSTTQCSSRALDDVFAISTKSAIKESYDEVAISSCLDSLGIAARQLLTDDVRSVSLFMAALELFSIAHLEAERARHQYHDLLVRGTYRCTILSTLQGSVKADLAELKDVLGKV